jgi:hypothetical protein
MFHILPPLRGFGGLFEVRFIHYSDILPVCGHPERHLRQVPAGRQLAKKTRSYFVSFKRENGPGENHTEADELSVYCLHSLVLRTQHFTAFA